MGMSASQARLLSLTGRLHDVELKAQNLQSKKIALATQKDELYQDYCDALDATSIKVAYRDDAMNLSYVDANYSTLCSYSEYRRKSYALRDNKTGLLIVSQEVHDAYEGFGNDKYAFAYALMGYEHEFGWQQGANDAFRSMGTDIGIGKSQESYEAAGFKYANDETGSLYMTQAEAKAYEEYIGVNTSTNTTSTTSTNSAGETSKSNAVEETKEVIVGYKPIGTVSAAFLIVDMSPEKAEDKEREVVELTNKFYDFSKPENNITLPSDNSEEALMAYIKNDIKKSYPQYQEYFDNSYEVGEERNGRQYFIEWTINSNIKYEEITKKVTTTGSGSGSESTQSSPSTEQSSQTGTASNTQITDLQAKYEALLDSESKDIQTQKEALKAFRDTLYAVCGEAIFKYMNINKNGAENNVNDIELNDPDAEWGTFKNEFNYYLQLWDAINTAGGCQIVNPQFESGEEGNEWFNNMVNAGLVQVLVWDDNGSGSNCWAETSPATSYNENYLQKLQDEKDIKKAEAKYEHDLGLINDKDKKYDLELSKLETTRSAITTEMDSIKKVKDDNIERTFGIFG